jgi:hypothetical protein
VAQEAAGRQLTLLPESYKALMFAFLNLEEPDVESALGVYESMQVGRGRCCRRGVPAQQQCLLLLLLLLLVMMMLMVMLVMRVAPGLPTSCGPGVVAAAARSCRELGTPGPPAAQLAQLAG